MHEPRLAPLALLHFGVFALVAKLFEFGADPFSKRRAAVVGMFPSSSHKDDIENQVSKLVANIPNDGLPVLV